MIFAFFAQVVQKADDAKKKLDENAPIPVPKEEPAEWLTRNYPWLILAFILILVAIFFMVIFLSFMRLWMQGYLTGAHVSIGGFGWHEAAQRRLRDDRPAKDRPGAGRGQDVDQGNGGPLPGPRQRAENRGGRHRRPQGRDRSAVEGPPPSTWPAATCSTPSNQRQSQGHRLPRSDQGQADARRRLQERHSAARPGPASPSAPSSTASSAAPPKRRSSPASAKASSRRSAAPSTTPTCWPTPT